jgi:hypothetical protein
MTRTEAARSQHENRDLVAVMFSSWYLLTPPISGDERIEVGAPLAQWQRGLAFSVEGRCADELISEISRAAKDPAATARTLSRLKSSICIADDDPRLGQATPTRAE